jgi:hypothetical protein
LDTGGTSSGSRRLRLAENGTLEARYFFASAPATADTASAPFVVQAIGAAAAPGGLDCGHYVGHGAAVGGASAAAAAGGGGSFLAPHEPAALEGMPPEQLLALLLAEQKRQRNLQLAAAVVPAPEAGEAPPKVVVLGPPVAFAADQGMLVPRRARPAAGSVREREMC